MQPPSQPPRTALLRCRRPAGRNSTAWRRSASPFFMDGHHSITHWLSAAQDGDPEAPERLLALVHGELRRLAGAKMAALPPGNTLQPTALVHEAWLRIARKGHEEGADRSHFFASAARAMRDILVEQARRKAAAKRGGDRVRVELELAEPRLDDVEGADGSLIDVDEALRKLEATDPRKGEIVNLRFFAGLTNEEVAAILGVSTRTVEAQWQFTKRWLFLRLRGHE